MRIYVIAYFLSFSLKKAMKIIFLFRLCIYGVSVSATTSEIAHEIATVKTDQVQSVFSQPDRDGNR